MNSPSRGVSQWMPMPGVVVTFRSPLGRSRLSVSLARADFELHEHVVGGAKQQVALLGQDQPARMAVKQRHRELLLERADLARHRRLREPELLAGVGEAAGFGGGVKDFELVPVHGGWSALAPRAPGMWSIIPPRMRGSASPWAARYFSASSAAMQPRPAAVTAWR